jgi:hypothetical protein
MALEMAKASKFGQMVPAMKAFGKKIGPMAKESSHTRVEVHSM